jgi:elongation factor P
MPQAGELKKGTRIEVDEEPYSVVKLSRRTPSARGAATVITAKLRNLRTKQLLERSWKADERLVEPDFEIRNVQYLYAEGLEIHHFMDEETYEQFALDREMIEDELGYILPEGSVRALRFNGEVIGVEIDNTVTLVVADCDPGVKGDTVNNVTKTARMETGIEIQVPLFVDAGESIVVDTREGSYIKRSR